jgi:hypothetical protein
MRPAIDEVRIFVDTDGKQKATVVGPIDLEVPGSDNAESEIYFWVRVAASSPHKQPTSGEQTGQAAEGIGNAEMELDEPTTAQTGQTASAPTMWSATVPVEGEFDVDGPNVFVEAWALVRTRNRHREFQIYWYDDDVKVVKGTPPTDSAAE